MDPERTIGRIWRTNPILRAAFATLRVFGVACVFHQIDLDPTQTQPVERDTWQKAPVIIVTKSEITYQGQLVAETKSRMLDTDGQRFVDSPRFHELVRDLAGSAAPASSQPTCTDVMEHLNNAVFAYDPKYLSMTGNYAPKVLASCHDDGWSDELKRCIVTTSPQALLAHACDKHISDELAGKVIARLGLALRPSDILQR